jgi:hypothetical protein
MVTGYCETATVDWDGAGARLRVEMTYRVRSTGTPRRQVVEEVLFCPDGNLLSP